jgi:predicted GNAT family acetyltransferase
MARSVADNPQKSRYELTLDDRVVGWWEYRPAGESVIAAHTEIEPGHEGEGLGSALVSAALDGVRASGRTVIPNCSFTAAYIRRHPEYVDLVAPSMRDQFS